MMMANYRLGIFCGAPGPGQGSFEGSSRGRGWGDTNNPFTHIVRGKRSEKKESFDFFYHVWIWTDWFVTLSCPVFVKMWFFIKANQFEKKPNKKLRSRICRLIAIKLLVVMYVCFPKLIKHLCRIGQQNNDILNQTRLVKKLKDDMWT